MAIRCWPGVVLGLVLMAGGMARAQSFDNENGRFVRVLEPGRVEAVTDYYTPDRAGLVRNSFAVGETGLCTATFISPSVMMTAAHCRDAALRAGVRVESYANRSMAVADARPVRVPCQRLLATGEYASGADIALFDCAGEGTPPPGAYFGFIAPSARAVALDQPVYSLWRNPVTDDPALSDAGMSTLVSPGAVRAFGVLNGGAGPAFLNCGGAPGAEQTNPVDSQIVVTDQMATTGASGSLSFDPVDDRAVMGPASTGNRRLRTAISMEASFGLGLPPGDRMLFEVLPPQGRTAPARVPTLLRAQDPGSGAEVSALVDCIDITTLHRLAEADADGDRVHDVALSEASWDWVQPVQWFDFTDPVTRAIWGAADLLREVDGSAVQVGGLAFAQPRVGQGVAVPQTGQALHLPERFSTLARGRYWVVAEGIGDALVTLSCAGQEARVPVSPYAAGAASPVVELMCDRPTITVQADQPLVTLQGLGFVPVEQVMPFGFAAERGLWASTQHPFALFTGDGTAGPQDSLPPTHFALNVTPDAPVWLRGVHLPDKGLQVALRARLWGGSDGMLQVGTAQVPLTADWQEVDLQVAGPALTLRLAAAPGAIAVIDWISLAPVP